MARCHPARPAVRRDGRTVTYQELDEQSGALAGQIAPGQVVAVASRDRIDYVIGMLAVFKAGGIYLPLDTEAPAERTEFILADAGATLLLTDGVLSERAPLAAAAPCAGYLIYTSGTTGRPKGVLVSLDALSVHIASAAALFGVTEDDVVLHFARPTVDVAVEQVLTALSAGACVVIPAKPLLAPAELLGLLEAEGVTVANLSAGYFQEVVTALREHGSAPRTLRLMISGSDRLYPDTVTAWRELTGVPLFNAYGPTETTITATVQDLSAGIDGELVPIGAAVGPRTTHVLDEKLRPCPAGTAGELYIGGPAVAQGYWGRTALTAERFVADPFSDAPGARMYRTGDVVRRASEGAGLEFVGRSDHQVKIRGFRVEPGEIEEALAAHPSVAGCVVVAHDGRLAAYATGTVGASPEYTEVRGFLAERLPEHMIPASLTVLDEFPLTAGGKIDRAALPVPGAQAAERRGYLPPRTPAEQLIAAVWSDILGVPEVGANDNFFHLGGDSLTAVRVVGRVFDVFGMISPYTIFDAPTLSEFAAAVTAAEGGERPPLTRAGLREAPLSKFQRGLWTLEQWNPGLATYNVPWVFRFAGPADPELLHAALEIITSRHESLRTTFLLGESGPQQIIHDRMPVPFEVTDAPAERIGALVEATATLPFDLETGPLLRAHAIRTPDGALTLVLVVHHITWDEGSLPVLENELQEIYEALREGRPHMLPELPAQYADYSAQQYEEQDDSGQLDYWAEHLRDAPKSPVLPTDHPRPEFPEFRGAHHSFAMARPVARAVREFARSEDATPFMVLLAGLALTLHRRSGEDDMVLGAPVSVRSRTELSGMIGYFINLLPLRLKVESGASFRELVRHVREVSIGGYRHQDAPYDEITGLVLADREDRDPLCQVLLELHPLDTRPLTIDGTSVSRAIHSNAVSRFDLSISVDDRGTDFTGRFEYDCDLFEEATMAELCDSWMSTLAVAVEAPAHSLFEAQVARTPATTALVFGDAGLTYAELNARANRLAHLLAARGVGRGSVVAILVERGFDLVTGLLAVLKTGAGYTLLDPDFPAERLAGAVADCGSALVLTHRHQAPPFQGPEFLDLDAVAEEVARCSDQDPGLPATGDDLACVMFTSGTTGRPKGVAVPHRALTTTYLGQDYASFGSDEVWLQCSPVSWDAFALELYGALVFGGVCVLQPGQRPDPQTISELTLRHGVTQLQLSASLFNFLLEEFPATFSHVRTAFTAGERASVTHVAKALETYPGLRVGNGYGPVESLGFTTCHTVTAEDVTASSIPIGRPLAGKDIQVLDAELQPVGPGVTGELYAAGGGLAYGYVGQPGLTAGRFVAHPHGRPGERLYRTGDLGHRTADGTLEITGRIDDQFKIRGFRVEPGEIEDVLNRHADVRECVVTVYEPTPGDRRLAAYVTTGPEPVAADVILDCLSQRLPEYMIPATLDILDALPLNANGKVDRRALPAPSSGGRAAAGEQALAGAELLVAEAMREVLGIDEVGRDDHFFRIGGNSLAAVRVAMRLSRETGHRVPPHLVFRAKTVSAIAERLMAM
ncbi:non-ribosomal peptide synthetase [Kitasatospora sp. MAA4]|uniref:non-ribosomal peptide synthetase n=1 Tax=Kitasatospora sp. MAA4 TaxID=3035093 RepID=UPI0024752331|nr:non-ribosomal peptide synthetase [Kitasatospora sp. MAA4]